MADSQSINVLKDVVVPLVAAVIGAGAALLAGYFAIVVPQREQRKLDAAAAGFAVSWFSEVAHLAASTILAKKPLGTMQIVLRTRIARFLDIIPRFAVQLSKALPDEKGSDMFFLMITELDRQRYQPALSDYEILFAHGVAATTALLLGTSKHSESVGILSAITKDTTHGDLGPFFSAIVDHALPPDIRKEVR
jgi:hypothetical protein